MVTDNIYTGLVTWIITRGENWFH